MVQLLRSAGRGGASHCGVPSHPKSAGQWLSRVTVLVNLVFTLRVFHLSSFNTPPFSISYSMGSIRVTIKSPTPQACEVDMICQCFQCDSPIIFGNLMPQDRSVGKLFDKRHLPFQAIHIAFMLLFAEIVPQVYEDKVEYESVAASLLIKWNLYQQNSWSKQQSYRKPADICIGGHIHSPMNCIHLDRNACWIRMTWRL